jgi:ABC transport system ATP-binding/permease protein
MVAQRGEGVAKRSAARPAPAKPAANRAPAPQQRASARKLSFNERHALATLPERIAELESSIAALERKLADPDLFARDPAAFERVSQALAKAQAALGEAEDRWLELDLLHQELEGSPSR